MVSIAIFPALAAADQPPPPNDDFGAATELPPAALGAALLDTTGATKQVGELNHAGDAAGHSVWFSWKPSQSGPEAIFTCSPGSAVDPVLAVYTGNAVNQLVSVAANDDAIGPGGGCSPDDAEVEFQAVAGTTYRIAVDTASDRTGSFELALSGRPANDDLAAAFELGPSLPASAEASTVLATKQAGELDHAGNPGGHSIWYSWKASDDGRVRISACAERGEFEPLLAVYTGAALGSLEPVPAVAAGSGSCSEGGSAVELDAVAGRTYRIAVDGRDGGVGRLSLELEGRPANDDFASPRTLAPALPVKLRASNELASKEPGELEHAGNPGGHSVWFRWTPATSATVELSVCAVEAGFPPLLGIYTGSSPESLTPVPFSGGGCRSGRSGAARFEARAGTTYRFAVDGEGGQAGSFELQLTRLAANDAFAEPQVLPAGSSTFQFGETRGATKEPGELNHAGDPGGHSVWYSWTPAQSGPVEIAACQFSQNFEPLLAVYTGATVDALETVASGVQRPRTGCGSNGSAVEFQAVAGTTYRIAVDGRGGVEGRFVLTMEGDAANDDFAAAEPVPAEPPATVVGSTFLATKESGEPDHAGNPGGHSVWFSWTPGTTEPVALSVCSLEPGADTLLAVYTGETLAGLMPVASNDDRAGGGLCQPGESEVRFEAQAGTPYRIAVDDKGAGTGQFELDFAAAPGNDDIGHPEALPSRLPVTTSSSNQLATKQAGEPDHAGNPGGHSVWFKWTAARTGIVVADTCASSFDTLLAVYSGTPAGGLAPVASNDDGGGSCGSRSELSFAAVAGTTYRIAVDGKGANPEGKISLDLAPVPANDDLAAATHLPPLLPRVISASNRFATKQAGEPDHAGNPGGHSVWYSWTPAHSGVVDASTCDSDFDTLVAVYRGSTASTLVPVAANDNGEAGCAPGSEVSFDAVAGTTYEIAIDGAGGDQGEAQLQLFGAVADPRTLSLALAGSGSGTISSSPAGLACHASCSQDFEAGTAITLTATPAAGSSFAGWQGAGCSGTGPCQLTLRSARAVTAGFEAVPSGETPHPKPKPPRCRRGFQKKRVHGKLRCVKRKPARKHRRAHSRRHH